MKILRWLAAVTALVIVMFGSLIAWGYSEATRDPVVVDYVVRLGDWPARAAPIRVIQLSDVHVSWPDMPLSRVTRLVTQVNALKPDLIVITGDLFGGKYIDRGGLNADQMLAPLTRLHAPLGVFAVRGNHDNAYWAPIVFARTPIPLLQNRWIVAGPVTLAGVDDITSLSDPVRNLHRTIAGAPTGRPLILLAHEPDFFEWLPRGRVDLMLAGHTHGGQIKFPLLGTRSTGVPFEDRHLRGQFSEAGRQLIVSSGIGTSLVPLRIGVPPEIVRITLGPATPPAAYSVGRNSGTDK